MNTLAALRDPKAKMLEPSVDAFDHLEVDTIVVGLTADVRPLPGAAGFLDWRLCGALSRCCKTGVLSGRAGERVLMPADHGLPAARIVVVGAGDKATLTERCAAFFKHVREVLTQTKSTSCVVVLPEPGQQLMAHIDPELGAPLQKKLWGVFRPEQ